MKSRLKIRVPLPGGEVEANAVAQAVAAKWDAIAGAFEGAMDALTSPLCPGYFSPKLDGQLCQLAAETTDAIGLARRLRTLHGERLSPRLDKPGLPDLEARIIDLCSGLIDEDAKRMVLAAAEQAACKARESRTAAALLPNRCPQCGGQTHGCRADGRSDYLRLEQLHGDKAASMPARRCYDCSAVTPNGPAGTSAENVIPFPREGR